MRSGREEDAVATMSIAAVLKKVGAHTVRVAKCETFYFVSVHIIVAIVCVLCVVVYGCDRSNSAVALCNGIGRRHRQIDRRLRCVLGITAVAVHLSHMLSAPLKPSSSRLYARACTHPGTQQSHSSAT